MRAPCDYCNGWFPKTFSALKVIMVAVVENKRKVNFKTIYQSLEFRQVIMAMAQII